MSIIKQVSEVFKKNMVTPRGNDNWPDFHHGWANDFPLHATVKDIYFCFRLILGRNPNKEEWSGHSARIGEPLADIVKTYVHAQEFHDRGLLTRVCPMEIKKTSYDGFEIYAAQDDLAVGKHVLAGNYEPGVTRVFKDILSDGMGVVDIGANIGYYSMLSASIVGEAGWVMAVEPNSENVKFIEASRRINRFDHLKIIQAAASAAEDIMVFRNEYSNGTCAFLPDDMGELFSSEIVGSVRIDRLVDRKVDLIKIDVEGGEFLAIQGCLDIIDSDQPAVIFEFSPPRIIDNHGNVAWEAFLEIFLSRHYQLYVIQTDGNLAQCRTAEDAYAAFGKSNVDHIDLIAKIDG